MCNNLQDIFPNLIDFVTLGHLIGEYAKKVAKDDKTNHGWENTL